MDVLDWVEKSLFLGTALVQLVCWYLLARSLGVGCRLLRLLLWRQLVRVYAMDSPVDRKVCFSPTSTSPISRPARPTDPWLGPAESSPDPSWPSPHSLPSPIGSDASSVGSPHSSTFTLDPSPSPPSLPASEIHDPAAEDLLAWLYDDSDDASYHTPPSSHGDADTVSRPVSDSSDRGTAFTSPAVVAADAGVAVVSAPQAWRIITPSLETTRSGSNCFSSCDLCRGACSTGSVYTLRRRDRFNTGYSSLPPTTSPVE